MEASYDTMNPECVSYTYGMMKDQENVKKKLWNI